jgi:hypothetical protein
MIEIIQEMTSIDWIIFAVTILAYFVLEVDILKNNGRSQNFFTWLLWGMLDSILFITTYKEKGSDLPIIAGCAIGSFIIAFSLLFVKKIKWRKSESWIFALVILTVIIWLWSQSNLVGIIFAVTSEVIAGIPLMRASWKNPGSRLTLVSYLIFIVSYILSVCNAPTLDIKNVLFPITFLIYSIGDTSPLVQKWWLIWGRYKKLKNS